MAAALAAENPLSMTFFSACGSASMAAAAMNNAINATSIWARYGFRKGSSARSGCSELALGLSWESGAFTELESAQVQFPPHAEIAREAVKRMPECRGAVALEKEMPQPGETVAAEQRGQQPPQVPGGDQAQYA